MLFSATSNCSIVFKFRMRLVQTLPFGNFVWFFEFRKNNRFLEFWKLPKVWKFSGLRKNFQIFFSNSWFDSRTKILVLPYTSPPGLRKFFKKNFLAIHYLTVEFDFLTLGFEFGFYPPPSALRKFFHFFWVIDILKDFSQFVKKERRSHSKSLRP